MTKEICMLARKWSGEDPTGFLMSEKFDGIRAIHLKGSPCLVTRERNPIHAPDWWLAQLPPDIFLDGELWIIRGRFQEAQSVVQKPVPVDDEWERVKFMCIEPMGATITLDWSRLYRHFRPIQQTICKSHAHLQEFYDNIVEGGGEGVVLRHPKQPYHAGRSPYLLKVKPEKNGVATVVAHRVADGLVSLVCGWSVQLPGQPKAIARDVEFRISNGLTEALRADPPAIGSQIRFAYQCLSDAGVPKFARLAKC